MRTNNMRTNKLLHSNATHFLRCELMQNDDQKEINKRVLEFTIELFKILFMKSTPLSEKYQMLVMHIVVNKAWFFYLLGILAVISLFFINSL
jgi:hypothetical protein